MKNISVAKFIVKKVESWGVKDVPVFQGGAIMNVLSEIGKSKKIKFYCPNHEQALAMAVDAYARLKGFGVGFVTSGPGGTNLLTGVACSYYDSIPCIFFTGQVGKFHITGKRKVRQRGFQETDNVSIFKPVTKFSYQIQTPEEINYILDKAYHEATTGRPGPVLIDIPFDIQNALVKPSKLKKFIPKDKNDLKNDNLINLSSLINSAKKPLFIAGGGLRVSSQNKNFLSLINKKNIPFVTTWPAQDIIDSKNKLYFGSVGRHAHFSACKISQEADLIVTFGVRFSPKIATKLFAKNAKIIAIDIDNAELTQGLVNPNLKINYDLKKFFKEKKLLSRIKKITQNEWHKNCHNLKSNFYENNQELPQNIKRKFVNPYSFIKKLSLVTPDKSILLTDAGCNLTYFMQSFLSKKDQRIISAWGNSPMGYSVAAGIGAQIASKKNNVISLIGDGSFLINLQELNFIKFHKIPLKIIVIDNKIYGNTKIGCEAYKIKSVGNDKATGYYPPDIKKIAKSFDIKYFYLKNENLDNLLIKKFINYKKACILHVNIHPDHPLIEHSNI
jgi:acetolactate synthase-1/2/3 large subunit